MGVQGVDEATTSFLNFRATCLVFKIENYAENFRIMVEPRLRLDFRKICLPLEIQDNLSFESLSYTTRAKLDSPDNF